MNLKLKTALILFASCVVVFSITSFLNAEQNPFNSEYKVLDALNKMQDKTVTVVEIEQEIHVNASVEQTFSALLDINSWWIHRYSDTPNSLRFEAEAGGRFWETRDGSKENSVLWGVVSSIEPNDHIAFSGNIGMQGAVLGNVVICTNPQDDGTTIVTVSHQILGIFPEGYVQGFDKGWEQSLKNLKEHIESDETIP